MSTSQSGTESGQSVAAVRRRPVYPTRLMRRLRGRWDRFLQLSRKALVRLRAQQGIENKVREAVRITGKARRRLSRHSRQFAVQYAPHLSQDREAALVAQREALSRLHEPADSLPACKAISGGAVVLSLRGNVVPAVYFRDRCGNLHEARIVDRHPVFVSAAIPAAIRLVALPPPELSAEASLHVVVRSSDEQIIFEGAPTPYRKSAKVQRFIVENGCVKFEGIVAQPSPDKLSLGLYVDGDLSVACALATGHSSFTGLMALAHRHLDGCAHLLELRELPAMELVASSYAILPLHITPWTALQKYAGPPLDGTLSKQARSHLQAYRLWFEHLRIYGRSGMPPLDLLHGELLRGFLKRPEYPIIRFAVTDSPIVSIIIPVHNECEVTYHCLCSLLFAFNDTSFEVIVVDDGSSDQTTDLDEFVLGIEIVRHRKSRGFVHAVNHGAARARGDFLLILNNDTEVTARWIDELVAVFRNFGGVGVAGSKLVYPDGRLQEAGGVIWGSGNPWNVGRDGNPCDPRYDYLRKVDYVSGAALMISRTLWQEVGGFSEEFAPGYFEDTDLAMKVREKGLFAVYVPTSVVYHFEGKSAGTDPVAGMKAFQEANRPKFQKKWAHVFREYGSEGVGLDREKDRCAAFRVLFIEHQYPQVDGDAGSYAAFQEMRLFQALGAKVTFLPRNLAWMDRHTMALRQIGVECLYAPYVMDFANYVREHARQYELVYVTRHRIAEQVIPLVRNSSPGTKIALNLADLHYLRERREAALGSPGYSRSGAEETRRAELSAIEASDLTFSYSKVELDLLADEVGPHTRLARMPWVVDTRPRIVPYWETRDILFVGSFAHPPNAAAVRFFVRKVMPLLRVRLPEARFDVIGSGALAAVSDLASDRVRIVGQVASLGPRLERARVFVAPLLAGAGVKGKVLDALSHGVPSVLSPIAAEGIGLSHGTDCLIAETAEEWADCICRLYMDEDAWNTTAANALRAAASRFSFDEAVSALQAELTRIGLTCAPERGLVCRFARPERYGT